MQQNDISFQNINNNDFNTLDYYNNKNTHLNQENNLNDLMNSIKEFRRYEKTNKVELAQPELKEFPSINMNDSELKQFDD